MRNQVVRRECVELLKRFLVGPRPAEPMAVGYKLVHAGATSEELPAIWRDVVSEIGRDRGWSQAEACSLGEGDRLLDLLAEYRTVIARADCKARARVVTPRRADDAARLRARV